MSPKYWITTHVLAIALVAYAYFTDLHVHSPMSEDRVVPNKVALVTSAYE